MNPNVLTIEALRSRIESQVDALKATLLDDAAALHRGNQATLRRVIDAERKDHEEYLAGLRAQLADAEAARDRYWGIVLDLRVRLAFARKALQDAGNAAAQPTIRLDVQRICDEALRHSAEPKQEQS